jgi:serine/threonine-protein kinase
MARLAALFALAVTLVLVGTGCAQRAEEGVVLITKWDLEVRGRPAQAITLPAHVEDMLTLRSGERAPEYTLHTAVPISAAMRGRDLTLAIPSLPARSHVIVDDHHVFAMDAPTLGGYREPLPQRFRIPAERSDEGTIDIEIVITNAWLPAAWLDAVPRLSATLDGDSWTNLVRLWNRTTGLVGLLASGANFAVYAALYFVDRRRREYGWSALQSGMALPSPAFWLGLGQTWIGVNDLPVMVVTLCCSGVASVEYTRAQFGLARPPRATWLIAIVPLVVALAAHGADRAVRVVVPVGVVGVLSVIAFHISTVRYALRKQPKTWALAGASLAWPIATLVAVPDIVWWLGLGDLLHGLRGHATAATIVAFAQGATLLRAHAVSLRRSDDLNAELAMRLRALEASNVEVQALNAELRRQISARSEQMAESLSRVSLSGEARALRPGEVIEQRYRVVRELGTGAMGVVYLVERLRDTRLFALKIQSTAGSPASLARLAREAQLASRVAHDNVVAIVDVDVSQSGVLYLVMEYVDGASLADMRDRFGDASWAREILAQIAEGLAAIHAASIVHRDLKPANVLVAGGVAKIADFGVSTRARGWSLPPDADAATVDELQPNTQANNGLTASGALMGTPLYMAPEAARGARQASAASDMFSFGVIAFEALSRRLPFDAAQVKARLRGGSLPPTPSLAAENGAVDARVADLVERCLASEPAARPTAREVADGLRRSAS